MPVLGAAWLSHDAGDRCSAGVGSGGAIHVWGGGPLGDDTVDGRVFPLEIPDLANPRSFAAGKHFLVVAENGALWGWGDNLDGQVGNGTSRNFVLSPTRIGTRTDWRQVNASSVLSFAVAEDGSLWAWGNNSGGQAGIGSTDPVTLPTRVSALPAAVRAISAGEGFAIALLANGTLWGWGNNSEAQLGDNTFDGRLTPAQIGADADWSAVAAGAYHVLAAKTDGSLWVWGNNGDYQLGDGTRNQRLVPTLNPRASNVRAVAAGYQQSLVLKSDGTLWGWGRNSFGDVGDGTTTARTQPVQIGTATDWVAVSAGIDHTLARKTDGTLWAWGNNESGQLGTSRRYRVGTDTNWGARQP
jgi:alpha-tubulin suppressor-like RCC1 family protein